LFSFKNNRTKGKTKTLDWKSRIVRRTIAALTFLILWSLVAWAAAQALIVRAPLSRADVIVVLGGSATYKERARLAAQLYHDGRAPRVILTNDNQRGPWSTADQRNLFYYERALNELHALGVPQESIEVLPQPVSSTYDEAVLLRNYAEASGIHNILVVTSAYHSRRALWTLLHVFKDEEIEVGLEPVTTGNQTPATATWWLYPRGWVAIVGEYLKIIYYRLRFSGLIVNTTIPKIWMVT
jgi:uncharacterized SAM-binding protein YcdF (DUF218 family)